MRKLLAGLTFWRVMLVAILALGAYATVVRFLVGLGASTHLSDAFPWGMWIGFDVMVGVGLAAGGFTVAATVHIFHLEKYEPVARPSVLTAFLGYLLVCAGLLFDLGRPWFIWHPLVMWNHHSVMFEVAWCVMIYTSVLALEFLPIVLERFKLERPLRIMRRIFPVVVIAGVMLSMMHQSSLGTLLVIAPGKLYPLWYTPWLPVFFFVSAVAAGLAMTIVESFLSHRAFGKELEDHILAGLARAIAVVLTIYLAGRIADLVARGALGLVFQLRPESVMFWGEIGLGVMLPIALFAAPAVRRSRPGLFFVAVLTVLGFVMNRLNVSVTAMARSTGVDYFPHWMELAVTAALVAVGFACFALAVRYLDLFPAHEMKGAVPPCRRPALGRRGMPTANAYWLAGLWLSITAGVALLVFSRPTEATQPAPAATPSAIVALAPTDAPVSLPQSFAFPRHRMSPSRVTFNHWAHIAHGQLEGSCGTCHQDLFSMRRPGKPLHGALDHAAMDRGDQCGRCHNGRDAFSTADSCERCHR